MIPNFKAPSSPEKPSTTVEIQLFKESPLIIIVIVPSPHRTLPLSQRVCKTSRQAVRRRSSTATRRVLRVHAHCAVARGRCQRLSPSDVGPLGGRRWRGRFGLRGGHRGRAVRCSGTLGCRRWRRRGSGFRRGDDLLLEICLGSPSLDAGRRVLAEPPSWSELLVVVSIFRK